MLRSSGRFVLRLDPVLHERLRRAAARQECSLNQLCVELLRDGGSGAGSAAIAAGVAPGAVIAGIARRLRKQLEGVVLFGSAARGEMWETSDIDLLFALRLGCPVTRELYSIWDAESARSASSISHRISPHFVSLPRDVQSAGGLWLELALDGVILWDPQLRVARLLSLLRREIASGAVVRRMAHGQPYWKRVAATA